jgi:hypothetical protein
VKQEIGEQLNLFSMKNFASNAINVGYLAQKEPYALIHMVNTHILTIFTVKVVESVLIFAQVKRAIKH